MPAFFFVDWKAAYIDSEVVIGKGTRIEPGVILSGKTVIGENCSDRSQHQNHRQHNRR